MQSALLLSLLMAAVGINAAPADLSPRLTSIPVSILSGPCADNAPVIGRFDITTTGVCFPITTSTTDSLDSARLDIPYQSLPVGCTLKFFSNDSCNSVNFLRFTSVGPQCGGFGEPRKYIRSAQTEGTC